MNNPCIHISGFKCFTDSQFELNKITLLTGANASGKSSVIQALLLLKSASVTDQSSSQIDIIDPQYAFDFGGADLLINNELKTDEVIISIPNRGSLTFNGGHQARFLKLLVSVDHLDKLKAFFANGLTYFCAERQGPRYDYVRKVSENKDCGCHGDNTGNVIFDNWNTRIAGKKLLRQTDDGVFFNIALDSWVDYIFPGIVVRIQPVGSQIYQVIVRDQYHNFPTNSTNIGFGISYALPIIVGALLAKEDSWLVVENPEAHIHAKAQSNMGFFLGTMASAGLRVLVETHSEHIVNGIRRAAIVEGRLNPEDVNIYFFNGKSESTLIKMDDRGNLSDFPVDFFDQSRQDMLEIISKNRE